MSLRPKHQRLIFILFSLAMLAGAAFLILSAFNDHIVYFYTPTELAKSPVEPGRTIRIGGLVEDGSVEKAGNERVTFRITDLTETMTVSYTGMLPTLFREGQGVVAEGMMVGDGTFHAIQVLAKHDENYMPPEVAKALKASGRWKGDK